MIFKFECRYLANDAKVPFDLKSHSVIFQLYSDGIDVHFVDALNKSTRFFFQKWAVFTLKWYFKFNCTNEVYYNTDIF